MTHPKVLLAGPPADAHTWNLIYLELLLQENGFCVTNLGPNRAHALLFETLTQKPHDLIVVSCLNGSVRQEGLALMEERSSRTMGGEIFVIGGTLHEQEDIYGTQRASIAEPLSFDNASLVARVSLYTSLASFSVIKLNCSS